MNFYYKTILFIGLVSLPFFAKARTYKLNYKPSGKLVVLKYDSIMAYTDSASLMSLYKKADIGLKNFILSKMEEESTTTFSGKVLMFRTEDKDIQFWDLKWAIIHLIENNKIVLHDKQGKLVKEVETKKVKIKGKGYVYKAYFNNSTGKELFKEMHSFAVCGCPQFK